MNITQNIIAARKGKGLTKSFVAKSLGMDASYYNRFECRNDQLSFRDLHRIAAAIGVSLSELIGEVNESQAKEIEALKARIRELEMDKTIYAQTIISLQNSKQ